MGDSLRQHVYEIQGKGKAIGKDHSAADGYAGAGHARRQHRHLFCCSCHSRRPGFADSGVQYVGYMRDLLQGDLGASIMTGKSVGPELFRYMPATLELMLMALFLTVVIAVPLGVLTALKRDRWPDTAGRGFAMIGISMPTFWVGLLLVLVFYGWLGLLPGSGRLDTGLAAPPFVTGLYLLDGLIDGNMLVVKSAFNHLLLPSAALALASIGIVVRMIRASMIEVMNEDYIARLRAVA